MDQTEIRALLKAEIGREPSASAWAKKHSIAPAYVNDVLASRREAGPLILDALGVEKVVTFNRKA